MGVELERFKTAQASEDEGFEAALSQIRSGRKTGHWIWYVLPQLAGLGTSSMSRAFALRDQAEAADYVRDPDLGERLLTILTAIADRSVSLTALMGSEIDSRKLVSSLTLFEHVARQLDRSERLERARPLAEIAGRLLAAAAAEGYAPCAHTMGRLDSEAGLP